MIRLSLRKGLLLLISGQLALFYSCQSSNKNPKNETVQEMPRPGSTSQLDSLKNIQQLKRDSLKKIH